MFMTLFFLSVLKLPTVICNAKMHLDCILSLIVCRYNMSSTLCVNIIEPFMEKSFLVRILLVGSILTIASFCIQMYLLLEPFQFYDHNKKIHVQSVLDEHFLSILTMYLRCQLMKRSNDVMWFQGQFLIFQLSSAENENDVNKFTVYLEFRKCW